LNKGDIWLVQLPYSGGHEQAGIRPAIILVELAIVRVAVIIPLTTKLKAASLPFATIIRPSLANGLTLSSVALIGQIRALDMKRLIRSLGVLDSIDLAAIDVQLKTMLCL
jgi:mRNA interferase MazF